MAIVKGAGMVMKAIIEEGDSETAAHMQDLALAEVNFILQSYLSKARDLFVLNLGVVLETDMKSVVWLHKKQWSPNYYPGTTT